jgi:hypothetical protein
MPSLAAIIKHALPLEIGPARVVLGFAADDSFQASRASEPDAIDVLTRAVRAHFGAPTQVAFDLSARAAPGVRTMAAVEDERRAQDVARARAAVEGHPAVREAIRVFGAQLREVKLPRGDSF